MISRNVLIQDRERCRAKAIGAICGLAIGDSLGDAARMQENRVNYGFTTDFSKGASWSTDDTEFALLTAQTLIQCRGALTSDHVVNAWLQHVVTQDELRRGGASEIEAANNLRIGLRPPKSGLFNTYHNSDGSVMRISPIGILCAGDPERAAALAKIDAEISHAQDGVWGAQAVAAAVAVAMVDGTMEEIIAAAMRFIPEDSWLYANMLSAFEIVEQCAGNLLCAWMPLHDRLRTAKWAMTAEALPSVFACLKMEHTQFDRGVILAANFGRDADTIGAVAGAILGAKFGILGIPDAWVQKTRYPTGTCLAFTRGLDLMQVGSDLAALIC